MSPTRRTAVLGVSVVALIALIAGITVVQLDRAKNRAHDRAERMVGDFLAAWSSGRWADAGKWAVPLIVASGSLSADGQFIPLPSGSIDPASYLAKTASGLHLSKTELTRGVVKVSGNSGTAAFHAKLTISGAGTYEYDNTLTLHKPKGLGWRIEFNEASVHPDLATGQRLIRTRTLPERGKVLSQGGEELASLDNELASNIVGSLTTMTAADAKTAGGRAEAGDPIGRSGLQLSFQKQLAGEPTASIAIADARGTVAKTLQTYAGKPGEDIKTTLDLAIQAAAERALSGQSLAAAIVAVDTTTGAVKAIVDNPLGGFPRALVGPYPPGSTFKIVTSTAALMAGRTGSSTLHCPKETKVEGRTFVNAEEEEFGTITFKDAFVHSCNTAYAELIQDMPLNAITDASKLFGFTESRDTLGPLPVPGVGGYFPKPEGFARAIGQGIGQDAVVASPVQMASVAAAVAAGEWRQPFITDPAPANLQKHEIPGAATLRDFMAAVVTDGTAKDAGLPSGTFGKTGTAEFGPGPPYKTHAWFVGFKGTTAFAVIIEGGGFGGEVAAPVAARFLRGLVP